MWPRAWWAAFFFIFLTVNLFGQTGGALDSTFNKTGKFIYQIIPGDDFHRSTAVAATSERIYLLGIYSENFFFHIGILALKPDGTLDPTFGEEGTQTVDISGSDDVGDIAVQPDGKILVCGYTEEDIFVFRLNPDGSMDESWGDDGVTITNVTTSWDRGHKIMCQPDGKVVVAGYCGTRVNDLVVVRYNANGKLDASFGTGGKFIFDFNGNLDRIEGLSLQSDGKIVIAGSAAIIDQSYKGFVMRLTTAGALDPTLNATGIVRLTEEGNGVAIRSDGKILCASTYNGEGGVYAFNQDGSSDASFGQNGFASSGLQMFAGDVACTANGNFYVFGYSYGLPSRDFVAVSYRIDGSLQTCFGEGGITKFDIGSLVDGWWEENENTQDYLYKGILQPDGKLLLAGDNQRNEYVLARLTNVGTSRVVQRNAEICQGDTYPFGSEQLTSAGVYYRNFVAEDGCDAQEVLKLSVRPSYNRQVNLSICPGESVVFNGRVLSSSGTYVGNLHTTSGCDSIVTVYLSINPVYELSFDRTICQGESVVFGSQRLTVSGTYTNRFSTMHGCDSIVTVYLSVNPVYELSVDRTICQGESVVLGNQILTASGTYTERFSTVLGCDSIVSIHLLVNPGYQLSINRTICRGESLVFGSQILTTSGTYTNQFSTTHGCDSIVNMSLSIIDLDNRISRSDNAMTAIEPGASYQWMDSVGVAIPGQNAQQFIPDRSGTYSVRVEKNGCLAVSDGISFVVPDIEEPGAASVYPNPSQNHVVLTLPEFRNPVSILFRDVNGLTIRAWNNVEVYSGAQLDLTGLAGGIYFLMVNDKQGAFVTRIVKLED